MGALRMQENPDRSLKMSRQTSFFPGVSWRQKLETQRGAVLANELKNNANKLAKWTAAAHISGTDMIKLGYVSRVTPKDNYNHAILGTQVSFFHSTRACKVPNPD